MSGNSITSSGGPSLTPSSESSIPISSGITSQNTMSDQPSIEVLKTSDVKEMTEQKQDDTVEKVEPIPSSIKETTEIKVNNENQTLPKMTDELVASGNNNSKKISTNIQADLEQVQSQIPTVTEQKQDVSAEKVEQIPSLIKETTEINVNNENQTLPKMIEELVTSDNDNSTKISTNIQADLEESQTPTEIVQKPIEENSHKDNNSIIKIEPTVNENKPVQGKEKKHDIKENIDKTSEQETIDVQTLTEQILNMLNEGNTEATASPQELLKKTIELQEFIVKLIQVLKEKTNLCTNVEIQNTALIRQAQSLKDVIAITKDLLGIRNMEVEHLHEDMASMENRIKEERIRYNTAVTRLNEALSLNDKLKAEYLIQMDLFQKLRDKYNEKVVYLTKENQRLNDIVKNANLETEIVQEISKDKGVTSEEVQEENVEK